MHDGWWAVLLWRFRSGVVERRMRWELVPSSEHFMGVRAVVSVFGHE